MAAEAPPSKKRTVRDLVASDDQQLFDNLYALMELHGVIDHQDMELHGAIKMAIRNAIEAGCDEGPDLLAEAFLDLELANNDHPVWEGHDDVDEKCRAIFLIDVKKAFGVHHEAKRKRRI
jgi:hypothetical protein